MRLTPAQRQARYRERYPERIAAYKKSEAGRRSDAKYRATHGTHEMNKPGTRAYDRYRGSEKYVRSYMNSQLVSAYGITYEDYQRMLSAQGGVCKICLEVNPRKSQRRKLRPLFVDHCHKTGKVRGLLCTHCNSAIGYFKENAEVIVRAISYLKEG